MGKNVGLICVSLMQEKNGQFRVLIRSALVKKTTHQLLIMVQQAWKSVLIKFEELNENYKSSINTLVLKEAMRRFRDALFPEESISFDSELSSPLNMISIDVNNSCGTFKSIETGVSRNSSFSSIRSSLTLSELRSSMTASQDSISFSRFGSAASLSDIQNDCFDYIDIDEERKMNIIEDISIKFFKSAYRVKDKSFPSYLLELEKSLVREFIIF